VVAFNRRIPEQTGAQALGLIVLAAIWLPLNFALLRMIEAGGGVSGERLLFELISAFATVGLSLDVTTDLSPAGKTLIIVNMFAGRIGLLTVFTTLVPRDRREPSGKPTENVLIT